MEYTEEQLQQAHKWCTHNSKEVVAGKNWCFYCLKEVDGKEVIDWTDNRQTALCPHCGVDSVVPISLELLMEEKDFREAMYVRYFGADASWHFIMHQEYNYVD